MNSQTGKFKAYSLPIAMIRPEIIQNDRCGLIILRSGIDPGYNFVDVAVGHAAVLGHGQVAGLLLYHA